MANILAKISEQIYDGLDEMVKFVEVFLVIGALLFIGSKIENTIPFILAGYLGFMVLMIFLRNLGLEIEKYKKERFFLLILLVRLIVHSTFIIMGLTVALGFVVSQ